MAELIVAVFDTEADASRAEADLAIAGVPHRAIRRYRPGETMISTAEGRPVTETSETSGMASTTGERSGRSGFWAWLMGEEASTQEHHTDASLYEKHVSAGQVIVSVRLDYADEIDSAIQILDRHNPVDVSKQDTTTGEVQEHVSTSTTATTGMTSGAGTAGVGTTGVGTTGVGMTGVGTTGTSSTTTTPEQTYAPAATPTHEAVATGTGQNTRRTTEETGSETVIPLAQEKIDVGARRVEGTTRVRRYVVETPVTKEVPLHDETVTVERRKPMTDHTGAPDQFEERTVEMHETKEVPVVEKKPEVTEEVVVSKTGTNRTETVQDTVRREDVAVEPAATPTPTGSTETHSPTSHPAASHPATTTPTTGTPIPGGPASKREPEEM